MITINLARARDIAHAARRGARSAEFGPLDIKATIPAEAAAAEAARQQVRDHYANIQTQIDAAATPAQLSAIIELFNPDNPTGADT